MKTTCFIAASACAWLVVLAGGCANSPPSDFYVLTPMTGAATESTRRGRVSLGVGPVKVPEYLNRAQIVTRAGPNRLDVNEFNRWGGSLGTNIAGVVAQNLSRLLGTDEVFVFPADDPANPRYRIIVSITQFDGTLGENVILDARWIITGSRRREQLASGRTFLQETTTGSGYDSYVAAQSRALESMSREIAAELSVLIDAGT